jgi:hypothetical protein
MVDGLRQKYYELIGLNGGKKIYEIRNEIQAPRMKMIATAKEKLERPDEETTHASA